MEHLKCKETRLNNPYSYRPEIENELLSSLPTKMIGCTHPTKVLRTASKILKLNLLECALLGWLLKRSNYLLGDLSASASNIAMFEEDQNKFLLLIVLLNGYHVKSFLSNNTSPQIDSEVLSLIPQFAKIYNSWRPQTMLKDATLEELNETFSKWTRPVKKVKPDYNRLVNRILELSKTYNVTGNDQEPLNKKQHEEQPRKKIKLNEQQQIKPKKVEVLQEQPSQQQQQQRNYMNKSSSMMLRSSRFNRNHQHFANIYDEQEQNEGAFMNFNSIRRSTRLRSRNFFFDLENSIGGAAEFPSQQLNNTVLHSNMRIQNNPKALHSLLFSNLKRTASNDIFKE